MKNINDVLKQKELLLDRVQRELEALRIVVPLLEESERMVTPAEAEKLASTLTPAVKMP